MSILKPNDLPTVKKISFTAAEMRVSFSDGREAVVPLAMYPRLAGATRKQLLNYEVEEDGYGIHWPDLDEDLSIPGMLRSSPNLRRRMNASVSARLKLRRARNLVTGPVSGPPISEYHRVAGVLSPVPKKKTASAVKKGKHARRKVAE